MSSTQIQTVVASAGAGKTTRIVNTIVEEVTKREPEQIVATTFTVKAADELIERARAALFKAGNVDAAARLMGARFGTVNSICGQIVSEFAIELGRSPRAEIIPEENVSRVFAIAANAAIEKHASALNALAEVMGYADPQLPSAAERSDWRTTVRRIIELARANGLGTAELRQSAKLSKDSFIPLLVQSTSSEDALDEDLKKAVLEAISCAPAAISATGRGALESLRQAAAAIHGKRQLSWPEWARLSKVGCAQRDGTDFLNALAEVKAAASQHPAHPRLHKHCNEFIDHVFECAIEALQSYQDHKSERGLLDFIDQEMLAFQVLQDPELNEHLRERIGCVLVDEFQDSSPLQIAIFTALAELVESSTWVGDPKQAIYGFRNADCTLTQAAFEGVAASSTSPREVLATSYRSRKAIVDLVNCAFEPAFSAMGLPASEHSFAGAARTENGFEQSPFSIWWLNGNTEEQHAALAASISRTIAVGELTVADKSGSTRSLEAGDVAVLCRSKAHVAGISKALSQAGLKVSVERDGLMRTPHVELVMAAFRWTADPSDRVALAELARYLSHDPQSDSWLHAASAADSNTALSAIVPIAADLEVFRSKLLMLTPSDLVEAIISLPVVRRRIEEWGDCAERFDDLEALRGLARNYETSCVSSGEPATPSGLILALAADNPTRPKSRQTDAVKVMTYHGAKGLEWPFVVLSGLNQEPKPRLFEAVAEAAGPIDWHNPLADRWIRYWPWPYGSQSKGVHLDDTSRRSTIGEAATQKAREEETRLLYVGFTRARDYLCFAPASNREQEWLKVLDRSGKRHFPLPKADEASITIGERTFPATVAVPAAEENPTKRVKRPTFVPVERPILARPPLHRRPSSETSSVVYEVVERIGLGSRIPITGKPDMQRLGEAVHAIFAAEMSASPSEAVRLSRAEAILKRWLIHEVQAIDVLGACDRLHAHLAKEWPTGNLRREAPLFAIIEKQLISGRVDLLVEDHRGFAVIDHKTFPGARDRWDERAEAYGAQLGLYAQALETATGLPCDRLYVHMPVVGALLRVAPKRQLLN